jgi:hypothetical protein
MPPLDCDDLLFDDENEAKIARHGVTVEEVQQVLDGRPHFYENRRRRRASHVMVGPTFEGRLLVVPIERVRPRLWRPITAFDPTPTQLSTYRSRQ